MIRTLIKKWYNRKALKRLDELRRQSLASYETQDFIRRRKAALKGERRAKFLSAIGEA